ncbi:MAG: phosphoglycerate dehydrogenase [Candidatus Aminicenantes bacterium]|nr:phosphoglycerate dehydrogenase [Candidatus Aminicenantes bacterium]
MKNKWSVCVTSTTFSRDSILVNKINEYPFKKISLNKTHYLLDGEELIHFLKNKNGAIIGRDRVDNHILEACPRLEVISKFGVGLDNIDIEACRRHKVELVFSEGVNRRSVAEQTLGFMIFLIRNLYRTSFKLKSLEWDKNGGHQLTGKKIGIIGVGQVGKEVVELLKPFECDIFINDIIDQESYYQQNGLIETSKDQIYKECDIITLHTPLTPLTSQMVHRDIFKMMKKSAFLINTARGDIVNQDDLKWALKNDVIAGAAVDVYRIEPPLDEAFLELPNLICTPHIGGNAREAIISMGMHAIEDLVHYFSNRKDD